MNNENKKSSSNTTPFNNRRSVLGSNEKLANYVGKRSINTPRNTSINQNIINNKTFDNDDIKKDKSENANLTDSEKKQRMSDYANKSNDDNSKKSIRNQFGPKNRTNNTADNLRDSLNTKVNDIKDDTVKKGAEALKKSANPYAKAAGYAASILQKRKEKKEKQEEKKEKDNNENNDNNQSVTETKEAKTIKKVMPVVTIIAPLLLIFLLFIAIASPILNAYSWFYSIFNHKSNDAESYYVSSKNDAERLAQEKAFNDAIVGSSDGTKKGIIQEYEEKYGVTIDKYLLIATVTYRYTAVSDEKLYTDDGNDDIDDEELNNKLEELNEGNSENESENNESDSQNVIDYGVAQKKIETVASMMIQKNGDTYTADNTVGGAFYNTLIDSKFLKNYYKDLLVNNEYETRKKLVDEIFEYAEGAREIFEEENNPVSGGVVGDTSVIHLQTCKQSYSYKEINGYKVYDNPSWSEGTQYPDYLNAKDYLKGVLSREIGVSNEYKEAMKAQAIAALTFLISDSNSGFNLKSGEMYFPSGTCRQATCSPTDGCTSVAIEGTNMHTFYVGTNRFSNGQSFNPLSSSENDILEEIFGEVFGKIMVNKGVTSATFSGSNDAIHTGYLNSCNPGTCFSQQDAISDARSGMNYTEILAKYYSGYQYDIIDITEGLYYQSTGEFAGTINLNESFHYHQSDSPWGSQKLCGSGAISGNGCNITSAAMVISLLKNQRITPDVLNNRQSENQYCSSSTRSQMIQRFGEMYGLNVQIINKANQNDVKNMVTKIASGNYAAVARIQPNSGRYATSAGHYVAIVGARSTNGVDYLLVWDPGSKSSSRDNAWVEVNYLVKYLQPSYSFILMGR